jgi:hypothetical protein
MTTSLAVMTAIQVLPRLDATKEIWMSLIGTEIFWPWYTLIGAVVTIGTAWLVDKITRARSASP